MPAKTLLEPRGCTNFRLRQMLRAVSRIYDAELARAGLKGTQFSLLSHLSTLGPIKPKELAERMGLEPSTLTRNLKILSDLGWAEQGPGDNARSRLVKITGTGHAKLVEARRHWKNAQSTTTERIGLEQVKLLHNLIDQGLAQLSIGDASAKITPAKRLAKH